MADLVERLEHQFLELLVDLRFVPEELLHVLHPFEVRHRHAAGVAQHIGDDENVARLQDLVGFRRRRAIGGLGENSALEFGRVLVGDLLFEGGGNENGAGCGQQFVGIDFTAPAEFLEQLAAGDMLGQSRDIDALRLAMAP